MSHEANPNPNQSKRPIIEFKTAILLVLILAGLFIAAIAFVGDMCRSEEGHGDAHHTEAGAIPAEHGGSSATTEHGGSGATHDISGSSSANERAAAAQQPITSEPAEARPSEDTVTARDKGLHH